jgi:hypothetical protein
MQIQNVVENLSGMNAGDRNSKKSDDFFSCSILIDIEISQFEESCGILLEFAVPDCYRCHTTPACNFFNKKVNWNNPQNINFQYSKNTLTQKTH